MDARVKRISTVAAAAAFILSAWTSCAVAAQGQVGKPVQKQLLRRLDQLSRQRLAYGGGSGQAALERISTSDAAKAPASAKKPMIVYIGADFCPYCAALRWPLVIALMRFGHFEGLRYMRSASDDVYPNTITFDFHKMDYQSAYVRLEAVEVQDREHHALEKPDKAQMALFRKFDAQPYTQYPGAIPFLYMNGRYVSVGSPVSPGLFKDMTWESVVTKLASGDSDLAKQVVGAANQYTAAICQMTNGEPSQVCEASGIAAAGQRLTRGQAN